MATIDSHGNCPHNNTEQCLPSEDVGGVLLLKKNELIHEEEGVLNRIRVEYSVTLRSNKWIWRTVHSGAVSVLTDESPVHVLPPASHIHINEVDVLARIGAVASYDAW